MNSINYEWEIDKRVCNGQLFAPKNAIGPVGALVIINDIQNKLSRERFEEKLIKVGDVNLEQAKSNKDLVYMDGVLQKISPSVLA
jgi:hypothetical protein